MSDLSGIRENHESAKRVTNTLRKLNTKLQGVIQEEVDLGKIVGTRSDATPDSVAIGAARIQLIALSDAVVDIGVELTQLLMRLTDRDIRDAGGDVVVDD